MTPRFVTGMANWLCKPPYYGVPWCVWLYVIAAMLCYPHGGVFAGYLTGYDDPVRMTQVLDWINGTGGGPSGFGGWYAHRIMRVDPPEGFQTIWSRLVDVPIALVVVIAQQFMTQQKAALAAAVVVPLTELIILFQAARYFVRPLSGKNDARLISLFLVFTTISNYHNFSVSGFYPGEASHHPWYLILVTLFYGAVIRAAIGVQGRGVVLMMAFSIGMALSVGIESFPLFAGAALLLAWQSWYFNRPMIAQRAARGFAGGALFGLLLLPAYQPPAMLVSFSFAEPSLLGPILIAAAAMFLWMASLFVTQWTRFLAFFGILFAGMMIGLGLVAAFPKILHGAGAGLSLAELVMAYKEHLEARPLFLISRDGNEVLCLFLPLLTAIAAAVWALRGQQPKRRRILVTGYFGLTLISSGMTMLFSRYYHQAVTVACGWLLWLWRRLVRCLRDGPYYTLAAIVIFVLLAPFPMHLLPALWHNAPVLSQVVLFPAKLQTVKEPCGLVEFGQYINAHYGKDTNLLVPGIDSSRLLYATDVKIDFLNNYPSGDKFIDNETFFGTQLPAVSADIVMRHKVDLVAVCVIAMDVKPLKPGEAPMMYELLEAGMSPPWLKPVDTQVNGLYHLYEVDKAAAAEAAKGAPHEQ